ncbi:hypothetical protein, partial [Mesorhizobium sp. M2A.F.Ca.ET.067.02.1.1]|uniref:hypothetical protein n=1 Tax=Mesorhizobium sp. M2A.F.Ca.ET.067.02.1.1 TaxID=2496749 RepID=UPI001AECF898
RGSARWQISERVIPWAQACRHSVCDIPDQMMDCGRPVLRTCCHEEFHRLCDLLHLPEVPRHQFVILVKRVQHHVFHALNGIGESGEVGIQKLVDLFVAEVLTHYPRKRDASLIPRKTCRGSISQLKRARKRT